MTINNPYDPRKILAHTEKLKTLLEDQIPYPITIEVDPVDGACNNKCIFCCFNNNVNNNAQFIKTDRLYAALKVAYAKGTRGVELVGGSEPTMHPAIEEIIQTISDLGFEISIVTNGLLLPRIYKVAHLLKYVRVSLDAGTSDTYKEVHGVEVFEKVIQQINELQKLVNHPQKVGLAYLCILQNTNTHELDKFIEIAISLKVNYVVFRPAVLKESWSTEYLDKAGDIIRGIQDNYKGKLNIYSSVSSRWLEAREQKREDTGQCRTCSLTGIIKANGDVPFCNIMRHNLKLTLGNIYEVGYDEIWGQEKHIKMMQEINIKNCPVPCKADDYRRILNENREKILRNEIKLDVSTKADPNFV